MKTNRAKRKGLSEGYSILSPKEYEAAVWCGRGASSQEIAIRLNTKRSVVEQRLTACVKALRLSSRKELRELFAPNWDQIDGDGE
jgi:DNA-binding CsgD family transcriptional regulator